MDARRFGTVDIAMLGSFGVWTRGTLQSRALPLARALSASSGQRFAIITTPWDAPDQSGVAEVIDDVLILNTRSTRQAATPIAVAEQLKLVRSLQPSIVHVMKPKAFAGLTAQALHIASGSARLIVDYDDWEGDGGWNDSAGYSVAARRLFAFQERRLLQSAEGVTVASTLLEERTRRLRQCVDGNDITFLPNGLEPSWMARLGAARSEIERTDRIHLMLYSRFAEFSADWLEAVLQAVGRKLDRILALDIIGQPEPLAFEASRRYRHLDVHCHGFVDRAAIPDLLGRATIALYPYDDNLINRSKQSVKLLELMASGLAIVASDVGDIRRIGGDAIELVPPGDVEQFADAVVRLVRDRDRVASLSERARERAASFSIDRLAERLHACYLACGLD